MYGALADAVVLLHFCLVIFAVGGQVLILVGAWLRWPWVRNPWFRFTHLGFVVFVAMQGCLGMVCPLTEWEYRLRRLAGQQAADIPFIARMIRAIVFYDLPGWLFVLAYLLFALAVAATLVFFPPRLRRTDRSS